MQCLQPISWILHPNAGTGALEVFDVKNALKDGSVLYFYNAELQQATVNCQNGELKYPKRGGKYTAPKQLMHSTNYVQRTMFATLGM